MDFYLAFTTRIGGNRRFGTGSRICRHCSTRIPRYRYQTGSAPNADIATDPRWARVNGTFGEDAHLSAKLTKAYILGFQGDSMGTHSVICQTKHFAGGGPQEDGWDAHFASGKGQVYPGGKFDYHLIPFTEGAFAAEYCSDYALLRGSERTGKRRGRI